MKFVRSVRAILFSKLEYEAYKYIENILRGVK